MTHYIQLFAIIAGIAALLWIIAGLLSSIGSPEYEDEIESEYPVGPGLPHNRAKK